MELSELIESDFSGTFPYRPHLADVGGYKMHYVDEGAGEPIVLLHGNPTWSYLYRKFIRPLSARGRVVAPDYLGFGKSEKPVGETYLLADRIGHLETLLVDHLDLKDATLVMHDWGGPIGLGWATRHPRRVRRIVVLNTWCQGLPAGTRLPPILEQFRTPGVGETLVQGLNAFVEGVLPSGIYRKDRVTEDLLDAYRAPFPNFNSRHHVLRLPRDIPVGEDHPSYRVIQEIGERVGELDVSSQIIWAEKDPVFPAAMLASWQEKLPHAESHIVKDAGHYLQEDAPDEIIAKIEAFLGS